MKVSDWQKGHPPSNGVWEIKVDGEIYYCRFKDGKWSAGYGKVEQCAGRYGKLFPYERNNDPKRPIKWRGVIDE